MNSSDRQNLEIAAEKAQSASFLEAPAWKTIGPGWRPLFGHYRELGFSFEWHDFNANGELDWGRSFHPGSLELCLNLEGTGRISDGRNQVEVLAEGVAFYFQGQPALTATRPAGQRHRFITVEFAPSFLQQHFSKEHADLHPLVRGVAQGRVNRSQVTTPGRLPLTLRQLIESLRHCPVFRPAQELWFRSKAMEIAANLFFQPATGELLCTRTQRLARERVEKVRVILKERMQDPPPLEELARLVNSSPYYLSRQFAQEAGLTMQQYLRRVRMERAAELLRAGQCNVTEAALEVGYNSLSHFSSAFHETFGCCPGLYPLQTRAQRAIPMPEGQKRALHCIE
jgi:AraC-like DNA-binding protein